MENGYYPYKYIFMRIYLHEHVPGYRFNVKAKTVSITLPSTMYEEYHSKI